MKTLAKIAIASPVAVGAMALALMASPADAQSRYDDRDRSDRTSDALIGAAVGAVAGALIGNGDGTYIAGGALAGAAVGLSSNDSDDCAYYRGGRCYRNQGHWEREHGINSRESGYGYRYDDDRSNGQRYQEGRTYQGRGYYRDGRFWRNHGQGRSSQNHRDRDYRYDRRW